jgi:hypothetical protein
LYVIAAFVIVQSVAMAALSVLATYCVVSGACW